MEVSEVMDEILKDEAFYRKSGGGVTFSGGEPFMQSEFLKALAKNVRNQEFQQLWKPVHLRNGRI